MRKILLGIFAKEIGTIAKSESSRWLSSRSRDFYETKTQKKKGKKPGWLSSVEMNFSESVSRVCCISVRSLFCFRTRHAVAFAGRGSRWFTARRSRTRRGIRFSRVHENKINSCALAMKIFVGFQPESSRVGAERDVRGLTPFCSWPVVGRAQNARKDLATIYRPAAYPFYFHASRQNIYICGGEKLYPAGFSGSGVDVRGKRYAISTFSRFASTRKWISLIIEIVFLFLLLVFIL